ncbi:MAG: nucleotidyl transferase AbiEii/AbiGii toxin family protein [Ornithinimicrobium sp.]
MAVSEYAERLVLKGGALLAAFGARRPTRDVDFGARDLGNDGEGVLDVTREIAALSLIHADGLLFDLVSGASEVIRAEDYYSGVRVSMAVELATARVRFHVDINVGDPVWSAPDHVRVPRLLGGEPIGLVGYPLHMVHAEKIVTAVQRGTVNTRWRDFGDVWTLSREHAGDGDQMQTAIAKVASHRKAELSPLRDVVEGYPAIAQGKWAAWRRKQRLGDIPETFGDLLEDFYVLADPAIAGEVKGMRWDSSAAAWQ